MFSLCKILSTGLQGNTQRLDNSRRHFWNCRFKDRFSWGGMLLSSMWVDLSVITCSLDRLPTFHQMHSPLPSDGEAGFIDIFFGVGICQVINKHDKLSLKWKHFFIPSDIPAAQLKSILSINCHRALGCRHGCYCHPPRKDPEYVYQEHVSPNWNPFCGI